MPSFPNETDSSRSTITLIISFINAYGLDVAKMRHEPSRATIQTLISAHQQHISVTVRLFVCLTSGLVIGNIIRDFVGSLGSVA